MIFSYPYRWFRALIGEPLAVAIIDAGPRQSVDKTQIDPATFQPYQDVTLFRPSRQTPPQPPSALPPRPVPAQPLINPKEPTFHPVSFQPKDLEEFLNKES